MTLPRPPIDFSAPIPNQPFDAPEVYYLEGNQGRIPLGEGLYINPETGAFTNIEPSPYIYCTPQYSNLPVTYPPYGCETEVNTAGVTDFTYAWYQCEEITEFPCVDSSAVTNFEYAWADCRYLSVFPNLNVSSGTIFDGAWYGCYSLNSFPFLNVSSGISFAETWSACRSITDFPLLDLSSGENFDSAWSECDSLTNFPPINLSSGTNFRQSWGGCIGLENLPLVNVSSGINFSIAWANCNSLTSFPPLNFSSGEDFQGAWFGCTGLTSFPEVSFDSGETFETSWTLCSSLVSFPAGVFDNCPATNFYRAWESCSLSQQSVDNILISLDTAGQENGIVNIDQGTSSPPSLTGWNAVASLEGKGWTVVVNGTSPFSTPEMKPPGDTQKVEFPKNPAPFQEFTDLSTGVVYKWGRTRWEDGTFRADIPETEPNEAWVWIPLETLTPSSETL